MRPLEKARGSTWGRNCEKTGEELWNGIGGVVEKLVEENIWDGGAGGAVEKLLVENLREGEKAAEIWSAL